FDQPCIAPTDVKHVIDYNGFEDTDNLVDAFVPAPPADGLKRSVAHIFVVGFALANRMLAEFQMRRNLPILEQGKAHSRAHCQNAFETAPGDHPEALDAGIIKHADRLA